MSKKDIRIVYMGTPEFAVAGLRALVEGGYNVVVVVTMPDKPAGRGHKVQYSEVKQYALQAGLPLMQPERLKDPAFIDELRSYKADLQIVTAFRMLPDIVWEMPRLGTINLHASLLPQYRGAAPINRAIMNGEKETGVTTFMLRHDIDTGDMIIQEKIVIGEDEDAGSLHDRLMSLGVEVVLRTVDMIIDCDDKGLPLPAVPQPQSDLLKPAPKIFKEDCKIDFSRSATEIRNHVRGLSPYPAAWCELDIDGLHFEQVKVFRVETGERKDGIVIPCSDGCVSVMELQPAGKKRMDAKSFINGLKNKQV